MRSTAAGLLVFAFGAFASTPPSVIFVVADDLGYNDLVRGSKCRNTAKSVTNPTTIQS
jgi:hypothetical protein